MGEDEEDERITINNQLSCRLWELLGGPLAEGVSWCDCCDELRPIMELLRVKKGSALSVLHWVGKS
jgi:hypothetical protein